MTAKRASRQQTPTGGPNKPSGQSEGAQPSEPTERKGGPVDDAERYGQQDGRTGEAGTQGFVPEELKEAREEEVRHEPLEWDRMREDKGMDP